MVDLVMPKRLKKERKSLEGKERVTKSFESRRSLNHFLI